MWSRVARVSNVQPTMCRLFERQDDDNDDDDDDREDRPIGRLQYRVPRVARSPRPAARGGGPVPSPRCPPLPLLLRQRRHVGWHPTDAPRRTDDELPPGWVAEARVSPVRHVGVSTGVELFGAHTGSCVESCVTLVTRPRSKNLSHHLRICSRWGRMKPQRTAHHCHAGDRQRGVPIGAGELG